MGDRPRGHGRATGELMSERDEWAERQSERACMREWVQRERERRSVRSGDGEIASERVIERGI